MTIKTALCVFIPMFILLFCYQNCQKPPYADEIIPETVQNQSTQNSAGQKVIADLNQSQIQNLVFTDRMPVQMNHSGKTFTMLDLVQFTIDWQSGVIQQSTSMNQPMARYCLNAQALASLKSIVTSGQVCEFQNAVEAGQLCTQAIVPGYLKVVTASGEVEVGSQSDGCGTRRIEFCDNRGQSVKDWFNEFKNNLANSSCP